MSDVGGGPRDLVKQVFLTGEGASHLSIWGMVVLSTEGTAPSGGPSASVRLARVCVCLCVCARTCRRGQPHVQGWGLLWALDLFLPGGGSGHVMPLAGRGGAGRLQQEAGR